MPLANAAKRGWLFNPVPMTVAFASAAPSDRRYFSTRGRIVDTEPASARPKPSRIDFLPRSTTSAGMSSYLVWAMKAATERVRPGALASEGTGAGEA